MSIERLIAFRYLKAKRKEKLISLIALFAVGGVALGVASLIVVLAVMSGFESNLKDKLLGLSSHIVISRQGGDFVNWEEAMAVAKDTPGVLSVNPVVYGQALLSGFSGVSGIMVKGIDVNIAADVDLLSKMQFVPPDALSLLDRTDEEGYDMVILGRDLSMQTGGYPGTQIKLISPFGKITPLGNRAPLNKYFTVAGSFESNFYELDSSTAYMDLANAQELFGFGTSISTLEIMVENIYDASIIKENIINKLASQSLGHFYGRDWMDMNLSLFSALKLEQAAMFVVLTLTILVAAFNIASTLIMIVMEKIGDIAILKAMGATRKQIRRIFTIQGFSVGLLGTSIGLVVGIGVCSILKKYKFISLPPDIYMTDTLPIEMRAVHLILIAVVAVAISYLATVYPAARASKLEPVEGLRYE